MSRAVRELGRIPRAAAALERDRELRRRVTAESELLKPGLYVRDGETMWRRAGRAAPTHARRTKGRSDRYRPLALARAVTSWFVVSPQSAGTAETVIAAFDGGVVVLDPSRGVVHRRYGTGPVSEQYIEWRERFTRYVSAPSFVVSASRDAVTEELVEGAHLLDVDLETQVSVMRELIAQYAALARAEGTAGDATVGERLRTALGQIRAPEGFRELYARCDVDWLDSPVTWVPSAFEATTKNLMVRCDGRPAPIDLGDLSPDACFVYPVGVLTSVGSGLLGRYLAGDLDADFADLMDAAGKIWRPEPDARIGLLLVRLAYAAYCDARDAECVDLEMLTESIGYRWAAIEPALRAYSEC